MTAARDLARTIQRADAPGDSNRLRQATVVSVPADRQTAGIQFAGSATIILGVACLGWYTPVVDDIVWVYRNGSDLLILGTTRPGAWATYTPVWTGGVVGNGVLLGGYRWTAARTLQFRVFLKWGSTTTSSSAWQFSLPPGVTTPDIASGAFPQAVAAWSNDSSASNRWGGAAWVEGANVSRILLADGSNTGVGTANPVAWAVGDYLTIGGSVETL